MKFRRFRTADGRYLDALLTAEDEFSVPADSHRADHEAGYGVSPLTVIEAESDPWDGVSELIPAPPRPAPPLTDQERLHAAIRTIDLDAFQDEAAKQAFKILRDAVLGERTSEVFSVVQTEGI